MSNWKSKSENSIKASKDLIDSDLHNESVHCSYYSCVQFVFHIMNSFYGMQIDEVEKQSHKKYNSIGTHPWVNKQLFESLKNKSASEAVAINNDMSQLCQTRVKADYKHAITGAKEANKAFNKAENILKVLKQYHDV